MKDIPYHIKSNYFDNEIILQAGFQGYPTDKEDLTVSKIGILKSEFPNITISYADHVDGSSPLAFDIPVFAVLAGAEHIEKHVCLDRKNTKYDFQSAIEPYECELLIYKINEAEKILGTKLIPDKEANYLKTTIEKPITSVPAKSSDVINFKNFDFRRTGQEGLTVAEIKDFMKKRYVLAKDIKIGKTITKSNLKKAKIGVIIACRMKSTRLKHKATLPIQDLASIERCILNAKKIKYPHPDLKSVLEETYGVLVYQEQVMEIANKLAGFTMSEADNLRMAMGKKKKELMKKDKEKFFKGCLKKGYKTAMIEKVWNFMEKFAAYGFNKPHSASYGLIAYWTGYIKANYPVEYMTALLTAALQGVAGPQREIKMSQAIEECRRMEIKVLPPDINKSIYSFSIEGPAIRFGLSAIKNIGEAAIDSILEERKKQTFHGLKDFLSRVDLRRVNKRTVESLIKAGAFSHFANKATLMLNYPLVVSDIQRAKIKSEKGQYDLFSTGEKKLTDNFKSIKEFEEDKLFTMEREVIGFLIGKNPMAKYKAIIEKKTTKKIGEVTIQDANKSLILAGLISGKKTVKTKKNNEEMAILQVFDESGTIEVVVFPRSYAILKSFLNLSTAKSFPFASIIISNS